MENRSIKRNTRWVQSLDKILGVLNFDSEKPVHVLTIEDGREVLIVQPNAFTISRVYVTGRPDGRRPHGQDSYYDYFSGKLEAHEEQHGTQDGFRLAAEEWSMLFEEAFHRYTRYLLCSGIKRWEDVRRDTDINLAVNAFARQYAPPEIAWRGYQYKGYILMMNSIAKAELCLQRGDTAAALRSIDAGIQKIGAFCAECLREEHPDAENVTREHYLNNLIEFRTDVESLGTEADDEEESGDDETDILAEVERLLNEE